MKRINNIEEARINNVNFINNMRDKFYKEILKKDYYMQNYFNFDTLDVDAIEYIINSIIQKVSTNNVLLEEPYFLFIDNFSKSLKENGFEPIQYYLNLEKNILKNSYIAIIIEEEE